MKHIDFSDHFAPDLCPCTDWFLIVSRQVNREGHIRAEYRSSNPKHTSASLLTSQILKKGFEKQKQKEVERTRKAKIRKVHIPGSKQSTQGYFLIYSRF